MAGNYTELLFVSACPPPLIAVFLIIPSVFLLFFDGVLKAAAVPVVAPPDGAIKNEF